MIISFLKITPMSDKRQMVIEILMSVQTMARLKPGCMYSDIYEDYGDGRKILYIEHWQAKEEMQQHIRSNLYLRVLNAIELASEPPEVFFHEDSGASGIELIKSLRIKNNESDDAT